MVRGFVRGLILDVELHKFCRVKLIVGLYSAAYEVKTAQLQNKELIALVRC